MPVVVKLDDLVAAVSVPAYSTISFGASLVVSAAAQIGSKDRVSAIAKTKNNKRFIFVCTSM